jgi:hypothetical protein
VTFHKTSVMTYSSHNLPLTSGTEQLTMTVSAIRLSLVFLQSSRVDPGLAVRAYETRFMVHVSTGSHDLFGMVDRAGTGGASGCAAVHRCKVGFEIYAAERGCVVAGLEAERCRTEIQI